MPGEVFFLAEGTPFIQSFFGVGQATHGVDMPAGVIVTTRGALTLEVSPFIVPIHRVIGSWVAIGATDTPFPVAGLHIHAAAYPSTTYPAGIGLPGEAASAVLLPGSGGLPQEGQLPTAKPAHGCVEERNLSESAACISGEARLSRSCCS